MAYGFGIMWGGVYESSFTCFHEAGEVPPGNVWRSFAQKSSSGVTENNPSAHLNFQEFVVKTRTGDGKQKTQRYYFGWALTWCCVSMASVHVVSSTAGPWEVRGHRGCCVRGIH